MLDSATIKRIKNFELRLSHRVETLYAGEYSSAFKGRGIEFSQVRKYVEGDDVRLIDWNVTARMREPYVKEYVEERELSIILLVDISPSSEFGTRRRTKRELVSEFAGTLAYLAITHQDKVGLALFTDRIERALPIKKGRSHFFQIMSLLVSYNPTGTGTSLTEAIRFLTRRTLRRSVVFLVSDFLSTEDLYRPLKSVYKRHDIILVRARDSAELTIGFDGLMEVEDPETGAIFVIDGRDRSLAEAYKKNMEEWVQYHERVARRLHLPIIDITTGSDITKPILDFIRIRERGNRRR